MPSSQQPQKKADKEAVKKAVVYPSFAAGSIFPYSYVPLGSCLKVGCVGFFKDAFKKENKDAASIKKLGPNPTVQQKMA